jgi:hypothetical protein
VGTAAYMPPEQAAARRDARSTAADVYGLGAILYEMLTGRPPFQGANDLEVLLQVLERDPTPPHAVAPAVNRDLETICLTCLRKEPRERYPSAQALADDLDNWLAGRPIRVRPVGILERGWKWVRRNPGAGLVTAAVAVLVLTAGVMTLLAMQAESWADNQARGRDEAVRARQEAEWVTYTGQLALAQIEWRNDNPAHARAVLDGCQEDLRGWEYAHLRHLCASHLQQTFRGITEVMSLCWSPDGKRLASAGRDTRVSAWDVATGQETHSLPGHTRLVLRSVCWSPDGRRLATASEDKTVKVWESE